MNDPARMRKQRDDHTRFAPPATGSPRRSDDQHRQGDGDVRTSTIDHFPHATWPTPEGQSTAGGWGRTVVSMPPPQPEQILHERPELTIPKKPGVLRKVLSVIGTINAVGWVGFVGMAFFAYSLPEELTGFFGFYGLAGFVAAGWAGLSMIRRMRHPLRVFTLNVILALLFTFGPLGVLIAVNWLIARGRRNQAIAGAIIAALMTALGVWQEIRQPIEKAMFRSTDDITGVVSRPSVVQYIVWAVLIYGLTVMIGVLRRNYSVPLTTVTRASDLTTAGTSRGLPRDDDPRTTQAYASVASVLKQHLNREQLREQSASESFDAEQATHVFPMSTNVNSLHLGPIIAAGHNATAHIRPYVAVHCEQDMPPALSSAMSRIVQEGLFTATALADTLPIDVRVIAAPGAGVSIFIGADITPSARITYRTSPPDSQMLALEELARSLGGSMSHTESGGKWTLNASLPWADSSV